MTEATVLDESVRSAVRDLRRDGRSPKEIARALHLRPSVVSHVVQVLARERDAVDRSPADRNVGPAPLAGDLRPHMPRPPAATARRTLHSKCRIPDWKYRAGSSPGRPER